MAILLGILFGFLLGGIVIGLTITWMVQQDPEWARKWVDLMEQSVESEETEL